MKAVINLFRHSFLKFQNLFSGSKFLARCYLQLSGRVLRMSGENYFTKRIINQINHVAWPDLVFIPKTVEVCKGASINIIPHVGEFDFRAQFSKKMSYEEHIFAWLLPKMKEFDAVFEIGANVGVYSVFFSKYSQAKNAKAGIPVYCFEPSKRAYERLLANIDCNNAHSVVPINSAVSETTGFVTFFEPAGHLTNGSLDKGFASQFAENVSTTTVATLSGAEISELADKFHSILLKIDVEGAEHRIIQALEAFILFKRPAIIIEVLEAVAAALNKIDFLAKNYRFFLITPDGLKEKSSFEADSHYRDYCLLPLNNTFNAGNV
jgi:FkbM family methyltransferase